MWVTRRGHWCFGLRGKISDGIEDGLSELIHASPFQSPIECLAYASARPPELDVILVVGHRILEDRESEIRLHRMGEGTRIMVRRTLAEAKAI